MTIPTGKFLVKRFEQALERFNGAYADPYADAEDRGDAKRNLIAARNLLLAGIPEWLPIETAPEDEHILIATTGGWVGTAFWTDEGDGKVWAWGHPEKDHGQYVHPKLEPLRWMPLPKHPEAA